MNYTLFAQDLEVEHIELRPLDTDLQQRERRDLLARQPDDVWQAAMRIVRKEKQSCAI